MQAEGASVEQLGPSELQREVMRLPDVRAARVVIDRTGRVSEIHCVIQGERQPKQIVRDIQTLAMARFGINLDYRVVSVVAMGGADLAPACAPAPRVSLARVSTTVEGGQMRVEVDLALGDRRSTGAASGATASTARLRLAAEAATHASASLDSSGSAFTVLDAAVTTTGGRRAALVALTVSTGGGREDVLLGSALVRADEPEAVARAVLDAVNRRLGRPQP